LIKARGSCAAGSASGGLIVRPTRPDAAAGARTQRSGTGFVSGATILGDGNIALILAVDKLAALGVGRPDPLFRRPRPDAWLALAPSVAD